MSNCRCVRIGFGILASAVAISTMQAGCTPQKKHKTPPPAPRFDEFPVPQPGPTDSESAPSEQAPAETAPSQPEPYQPPAEAVADLYTPPPVVRSIPSSLIPSIGSGGLSATSRPQNLSGLTTIIRPNVACGLSGTLLQRGLDCASKNPTSSLFNDSGVAQMSLFQKFLSFVSSTPKKFDASGSKYSWRLLMKTAEGYEVWRDNLTGLIWSDVVGGIDSNRVVCSTDSTTGEKHCPESNVGALSWAWCAAAGANNKQGSPLASADPFGYCGGTPPATLSCNAESYPGNVVKSDYCFDPGQSQTAPVSLCAEDPVNLNGTLNSDPAKGGFGRLQGASSDVNWWLPSVEDYSLAIEHGAATVLPNMKDMWFWTSTMKSDDRKQAWGFWNHPDGSGFENAPRDQNVGSVRCVGADPSVVVAPPVATPSFSVELTNGSAEFVGATKCPIETNVLSEWVAQITFSGPKSMLVIPSTGTYRVTYSATLINSMKFELGGGTDIRTNGNSAASFAVVKNASQYVFGTPSPLDVVTVIGEHSSPYSVSGVRDVSLNAGDELSAFVGAKMCGDAAKASSVTVRVEAKP